MTAEYPWLLGYKGEYQCTVYCFMKHSPTHSHKAAVPRLSLSPDSHPLTHPLAPSLPHFLTHELTNSRTHFLKPCFLAYIVVVESLKSCDGTQSFRGFRARLQVRASCERRLCFQSSFGAFRFSFSFLLFRKVSAWTLKACIIGTFEGVEQLLVGSCCRFELLFL